MRMMFGLVSVLVMVGAAVMFFSKYELPVVQKGHDTQGQAERMSGRNPDSGMAAKDSYTAKEFDQGSTFKGIEITSVVPAEAMEKTYGLKKGDVVLAINDLDVTALGDYGSAKAQLDQAYQENKPLTVMRSGVKMVLPQNGKSTANPGNPLNNLPIPMH